MLLMIMINVNHDFHGSQYYGSVLICIHFLIVAPNRFLMRCAESGFMNLGSVIRCVHDTPMI